MHGKTQIPRVMIASIIVTALASGYFAQTGS